MATNLFDLASELSVNRGLRSTRRISNGKSLATSRYSFPLSTLPAVHLANRRQAPITRTSGSRAHKLNEAGQPQMRGTTATADPTLLTQIINWLDVEHSARYQRAPDSTYCNIYAYDFCCFAGPYLPRVWWHRSVTNPTPAQVANPAYGREVFEQNANSLYDWFISDSTNFNWTEETPAGDYTTLQNLANAGHVVVIVYKNPNGSGHICMIVPEVEGQTAIRDAQQKVTHPLQSQAGAHNYKYSTRVWWGANAAVKFYVNRLAAGNASSPSPTSVAHSLLSNTYSANAVDTFAEESPYYNTISEQMSVQDDFISQYCEFARDSMRRTQVPASVTLAQAALESGWGRHAPGYNFFGIKAGRHWTGQRQLLRTTEIHSDNDRSRHNYPEVISIEPITEGRNAGRYRWVVRDNFRQYANAVESFDDHGNFLRANSRYAPAFLTTNAVDFVREIARAGYATDPGYADSLISIINRYNLTRFDALPAPEVHNP